MSGSTRCTSWRRWRISPITLSTTCPGTRRWSVPSSRLRHLRRHSETADELLGLIAQLRAGHAPPLLRGDEIAEATGARGAEIKRLVDMLAEEQAAGSVATRKEALAYVREQVR